MPESSSWRELLGQIAGTPAERERLANETGVRAITLGRWISGESTPRPHNVRQLLEAIPPHYRLLFQRLLREEPEFSSDSPMTNLSPEIDYPFIMQVLDARTTTLDSLRFWTISRLVLQHALRRLDPDRLGMAITVVCCMPPSAERKIRSLRESFGQGTPPWEGDLETKGMFLGAESLAGYAVMTCCPRTIHNLAAETMLLPARRIEHEMSALAYPMLYANRVAGCLLFSSTQVNYFSSDTRLSLIHGYTQLLALAFEPHEFYAPDRLELHTI